MLKDVRHLTTVDPGWTTGVCEMTVDFSKGMTVKGLVRRALRTGKLLSYEVGGSVESQCCEIGARWDELTSDLMLRGICGRKSLWFGVEDFDAWTLAADLVPVEVKGGLKALMIGAHPQRPKQTIVDPSRFVLQMPSMKRGCSDKRLRRLGLWSRSAHERDARRHMVVLVDRILSGDLY